LYRGERGDDLLKLKPYGDAEATAAAHLSGIDERAGALGAAASATPSGAIRRRSPAR